MYSCGLVHAVKAPASSLHSNVEPGSFDSNANVAVVSFVGSVGPDVIVVSGALVSIVQLCVAGVASVLPAMSVALTSNT